MKLVLAALAALLITTARADTITYRAKPNSSSMKVNGTSTVHDWEVESKVIGGTMELDSNFPLDPTKDAPTELKVIPKVDVKIPVRQLKSDKSLMDTVMHNAMKAEEFPTIEYTLLEMTPKGKAKGSLAFGTKGVIKCAGVSKTNEFDVFMSKVDNNVKVTGSTKVKMTDFGIQPPAPKIALGAIKTGDDVTLTFEWIVAPKKTE